MCTIDSKDAEDRGYFKIDFLHVHQYDGIKDEEHLLRLMHTEPLWEMLEDEFFVKLLSQIHSHFEVVSSYAPKSVEQLAMILGMIRPAKMYLQGLEWDNVEKEIWKNVREYESTLNPSIHITDYKIRFHEDNKKEIWVTLWFRFNFMIENKNDKIFQLHFHDLQFQGFDHYSHEQIQSERKSLGQKIGL